MRGMFRILTAASLALFSSGCATIITQADQEVAIRTDPDGAECKLVRDGTEIAVAGPTPSVIEVDNSYKSIELFCKRDGHFESRGMLTPGMQPLILGNILLGGIIGFVIDFATGAASAYPSATEITLVPTSFPTATARDQFFDRQLAKIDGRVDKAVADAKALCESDDATTCGPDVSAMRRDAAADRQRLLSFRDRVSIAGGMPAAGPSPMASSITGGDGQQRTARVDPASVYRTTPREKRRGFYGP